MLYDENKKKKVIKNLNVLLDKSNKIKAITKTRFLDELEKVKNAHIKIKKTHLMNILNHIFSGLEGNNADNLKKHLRKKIEATLQHIDKSEEEIIKNTLKKVKHTSTIIVGKNTPIIPHLLKIAKRNNKKINIITSIDNKTNPLHIDLALIHIDRIDSNACMLTNKDYMELIEKANKHNIPVYCYTHSFNFTPNTKKNAGKAIIKPGHIKSIISEIGIFEPEIFIQELKLNYPCMFKQPNSTNP